MLFEVFKRNGFHELSMGTYEAENEAQAKELAENDIKAYGWYVSQAIENGKAKLFKITYVKPFSHEEDYKLLFAESKEIAKNRIMYSNIVSIEEQLREDKKETQKGDVHNVKYRFK